MSGRNMVEIIRIRKMIVGGRARTMRLIVSYATGIALAIVVLAACNSNDGKVVAGKGNTNSTAVNNATMQPSPGDGVRRMTVSELSAAVDKGAVFIVDVRNPEAYAIEHIKGSVNIPDTNVVARAGELPRNKLIVTYCS